jgi:hypothetical protein
MRLYCTSSQQGVYCRVIIQLILYDCSNDLVVLPPLSSLCAAEAFGDTHPRVRDAGKTALEDVGSVIRNPEVASLSNILQAALCDAK